MKTMLRASALAIICVAAPTTIQVAASTDTQKLVAQESRAFQTMSNAYFLYESTQELPSASNIITFDSKNPDENLEKTFSSQKNHSFIKKSNSPAFASSRALIHTALRQMLQTKSLRAETLITFRVSASNETFVTKFVFDRFSNISDKITVKVTTYGNNEALPVYFLNFLKALTLENTVWQNHAGKIATTMVALPAAIIIGAHVLSKSPQNAAQAHQAVNHTRRQLLPTSQPAAANTRPYVDTPPVYRDITLVLPAENCINIEDKFTQETCDNLYDQIFAIANTPLQTANDAGHWWTVCNQINNAVNRYGGIVGFIAALKDGRISPAHKLYKLFLSKSTSLIRPGCSDTSKSGIVYRLVVATLSVSLYRPDTDYGKVLHAMLGLQSAPGFIHGGDIPWTNVKDEQAR